MTGIIGANVRRLRTAAGMSQAQLGEALDVHQSTVAYWENTSTWSPNEDDIRHLCALFRIEPNDLLMGILSNETQQEADNATT